MEQFARTESLIGHDAIEKLFRARVAVFGVGGVGSWIVEALCRAGVGKFLLVDFDTVTLSNCNRQIHAMTGTVGQFKTHLMRERILAVNPAAQAETREVFCDPGNIPELLAGEWDYIVDAVDNVTAKIALAEEADRRKIPIIAAMGAGNKLDPSRFEIADIYSTSVCPLCRAMRGELKKRGIPALKVAYSKEPPARNLRPPGSVSFVPSAMGLLIAAEIFHDLTGL